MIPIKSSFVLLFIANHVDALDNGLAKTPPMGWNTSNKFQCNINENVIKSVADSLVSKGLKDAGYAYIIIDDCWSAGRDKNGIILAKIQVSTLQELRPWQIIFIQKD